MWKLTEKIPDFTYWKSVFLDTFCSVLTMLLDAPEFFYEDLVQTQLDHWELVLGAMVCPSKNLDFLKIFSTNRILPNQAKKLKMGHVQDSPVSTNMIPNEYMIYHMKVHIVSYNLG